LAGREERLTSLEEGKTLENTVAKKGEGMHRWNSTLLKSRERLFLKGK